MIGMTAKIMLPFDPLGKQGPKEPLADVVTILNLLFWSRGKERREETIPQVVGDPDKKGASY